MVDNRRTLYWIAGLGAFLAIVYLLHRPHHVGREQLPTGLAVAEARDHDPKDASLAQGRPDGVLAHPGGGAAPPAELGLLVTAGVLAQVGQHPEHIVLAH